MAKTKRKKSTVTMADVFGAGGLLATACPATSRELRNWRWPNWRSWPLNDIATR